MEYQYTINDIRSKVNVSLQSLYTLIKKNDELIKANSIRKQRKVYYNQTAMDFFVTYYNSDLPPETPDKAEKPTEEGSHATLRLDALEAQIDALQAEIRVLKEQLDAKEAERLELLRQNGALILTLQQSQQEKMLLLPAPKKSLSAKVKSLFKGKSQE